jgi:hypothetical protein
MTDDERALSVALHEAAGYGPSGSAPPIDRLLSRGRRRRHGRAALACAAGVTGAGVVAALASAGPRAGASPDTASGMHGATQSGPIALSLAAERTDDGPFRFSLTAKTTEPAGKADERTTRTATSEGAFDPSTMHGYTKAVGGMETAESIRIGDVCYSQPTLGAPWLRLACPASANDVSLEGLTQDPAAGLEQLKAAGLTTYVGRSGTGAHEVDTWKFTFSRKPQESPGGGSILAGYTVTGKASVGVADGQVSAIDYTITPTPGAMIAASVTDVSITFSDYGAPVNVSAPAAVSTQTN